MKRVCMGLIAMIMVIGCDEGIDPLTEIDPGADESAPQVTINAPTEGNVIQVPSETASITIDFEVTDDIEVGAIEVMLDGNQIEEYDGGFMDYRRVLVDDLVYSGLRDGSHELTITATDLDGKSTSASVNFSKEPPYISQYEGEILYMPFDGDYVDLISFDAAAREGNPGFIGEEESLAGTGAYSGAPESYLTFPSDRFKNAEFSAIFWMNINAVPDRAGVLVMSPPLIDGVNNDLTKGFRFFRENAAGLQRFKLNIGSGNSGHWFDGGEAADVDPTTTDWVNLAFTISAGQATVYIDGQVVSQGEFPGIDWTDANILSIMSGAPNFTQWNHLSDQSTMDELRIFDRAISQEEVRQIIADDSGEFVSAYTPTFDGEIFYMPFDDSYVELFRDVEAEVVGSPGFAGESVLGSNAYEGAAESYLTFPTDGTGAITPSQFSATLWYKLNADPTRAGILTISPEDPDREGFPEVQNNRTSGFRFLREGDETRQVFKLNVGTGESDVWVDGADAAALDPETATDWVHLAFTISEDTAVVYINGEPVGENAIPGIDWTGTQILSIASGAPRFTEWGHLSDPSLIDELRFYDKALTPEEIQATMVME